MKFLFPSDYFNLKQVDEAYLEQANCLQSRGFGTAAIALNSLGSPTPKIHPKLAAGSNVVYRGWMLTADEYASVVRAVNDSGSTVFTTTQEYTATHYLPNWYPLLHDLTPETHFFSIDDDLEYALNHLGWNQFFIKDYVKSLKTSVGSIINEASEIQTVVAEMQKFRGKIEGGICVRQVEDFITETEQRYFVIHRRPFANSPMASIPAIVDTCAQRIDSKFFSVDVVKRRDGSDRIVEIGDGQVSDLVNWTADRFAALWSEVSL